MPITYTVHPQHFLLVSRFEGAVGEQELLDAYADMFRNSGLAPGFHELTDLRQAETLQLSRRSMEALAQMAHAFHGDKRKEALTAHLVDTQLHKEASELYQVFATLEGEKKFRTFTDVAQALDWLGAPGLKPEDMHGKTTN